MEKGTRNYIEIETALSSSDRAVLLFSSSCKIIQIKNESEPIPDREHVRISLHCVSLTKKMHPVMLAAQRFCGFLAPIHFQPHRSATKLVFNHYNGRQFLCKVNSENDEEKFESGKRIPGMGIIHSWYPFSAHSFSLMICSYSRTYFSSMTRFVW